MPTDENSLPNSFQIKTVWRHKSFRSQKLEVSTALLQYFKTSILLHYPIYTKEPNISSTANIGFVLCVNLFQDTCITAKEPDCWNSMHTVSTLQEKPSWPYLQTTTYGTSIRRVTSLEPISYITCTPSQRVKRLLKVESREPLRRLAFKEIITQLWRCKCSISFIYYRFFFDLTPLYNMFEIGRVIYLSPNQYEAIHLKNHLCIQSINFLFRSWYLWILFTHKNILFQINVKRRL